MASNDVTRDRRNDSKSERSDGKDADHCGEKTVVVRREWRASWMSSERRCKGNGKGEAQLEGEEGGGDERKGKK